MANIAFIHRGGEGMASYRYRTKIPAEQLAENYTTSINEGMADIVVFSKPVTEDAALAKQCKLDGTKVIVDICDDHFNSQGNLYREMIKMADQVVCPSNAMRDIIYQQTSKDSHVISDPYEQKRQLPHADGEKLLWFGHKRNLMEITRWLKLVPSIQICTNPNKVITGYIPWSEENLRSALLDANVVFLPTLPGSEYKSPNRLINAIMAGCFALCDAHPAYTEFREFVWVGKAYSGLSWIRAFKDDLNALVNQAQDYIEDNYSPKIIGRQWTAMIESL